MSINEEINRRIKILSDFNRKLGVKVQFLGTLDKYYTYLSDVPIEPGIYFRSTNAVAVAGYEILRVVECSHEVLYNSDEATLNILRRKAVIFNSNRAEDALHEAHADAISKLAKANEYKAINGEVLIKETLFNKNYELYMQAVAKGKSKVDFVLPRR